MAMLNKIKEKMESLRAAFWCNGWTIIESLCLFMACINTLITIAWYILASTEHDNYLPSVRMYYTAIFVVVVWLRLNRCFRSHQSFGPFVAMLGQCAISSVKIGFLFFEFFIPFSVTCWVIFGGRGKLLDSMYISFIIFYYLMWDICMQTNSYLTISRLGLFNLAESKWEVALRTPLTFPYQSNISTYWNSV